MATVKHRSSFWNKQEIVEDSYRKGGKASRIGVEQVSLKMSEFEKKQRGFDGKVSVAFQGDVALLTFECGENRFNPAFAEKVNKALDEVLQNKDARILVTTGTGKFYSLGLDIDWLMELMKKDYEFFHDTLRVLTKLSARMLTFPLPTVAAINGHCYANGAVFSLCHDYRVMQTGRGWWCMNEVLIGFRMNDPVLNLIRAKLPTLTFHEGLVLARNYTADDAVKCGVVHETCDPSALMETAVKLGKRALTKNGINRTFLQNMKEDCYHTITDGLKTGKQAKL